MTDSPSLIRKKLIEHSLPLDAINAASSREKSVRHGHPSTLHLWWARRPLAACRAVLFGQLVDDPSAWPERFPTVEEQDRERRSLHKVIADMVEWPKSTAADQRRFETAIETARWEIARSVAWGLGEEPPAKSDPAAVFDYLQTKAPPVYDPFCGGGSIPLEAQRLGLRAYGSDLNPIAVLITKALIEFPPRFAGLPPVHPDAKDDLRQWTGAQGLAEDVRRYGQWMRDEAVKRIGHFYPNAKFDNGREATVIAWLWARTVASPDPAQKGAHVPLASSFVLSSKNGKEAIVVPMKDPSAKDGWRFEVKTSGVTKNELATAQNGTKAGKGQSFICVLSNTPIERRYIQAEGKAQRLGVRLMAIVAEGESGREYLAPLDIHQSFAEDAALFETKDGVSLAETLRAELLSGQTPTRAMITGGVCSAYGLGTWGHLFSDRQLVALTAFSDLISAVHSKIKRDAKSLNQFASGADRHFRESVETVSPTQYADAVSIYLSFAVNKLADRCSTLCTWDPGAVGKSSTGGPGRAPAIRNTFGRQAFPMSWDFAEINPLSETVANFRGNAEWIGKVLERVPAAGFGHACALDAAKNSYPVRPVTISTDPPYYDNIGYAVLSDFFYVWSRRCLQSIEPSLFRRLVTPKAEELVATPYLHGGRQEAEAHFLKGMSEALRAMRAAATDDSPLGIYYAFKQSEAKEEGIFSPGWAAFLQAVVDAGLQIDGTWPIRTEMASRQIAASSNALAASVALVCRKRAENARAIGRREFLRELKPVMAEAIVAHQKAGIPLPDRRQAAIGPGIGVFSKYSMVREPDDSPMRVATALALINKEIDSLLSEGTEELDPETRFALEWYQMQGYALKKGGSGDAIAQLQAFNLSENRINASGVFRAKGGDAKLLTRDEMHAAILERFGKPWRPSIDDTFTAWEFAQHMARSLRVQDGGVDAAGRLLAERRDGAADVLLIAERLFELATTRGENEEALVWNELQTSWPEIESAADRATEAGVEPASKQAELGL